jgi:hypothetical protein
MYNPSELIHVSIVPRSSSGRLLHQFSIYKTYLGYHFNLLNKPQRFYMCLINENLPEDDVGKI